MKAIGRNMSCTVFYFIKLYVNKHLNLFVHTEDLKEAVMMRFFKC